MTKELIIASMGLSLFIICPRMAGMVYIISKNSNVNLYATALYGTIIAIPLVLAMVWVFSKSGALWGPQNAVWGALVFCVLTDILSALFMKEISIKAGVETIIIAIFVIIGVKVAPYITGLFVK